MKKVFFLLFAAAYAVVAIAQSAPGAAPGNFNNTCNSSNCTAPGNLCVASSNTITNFSDKQYVAGTGATSTSAGAVWKYYNVATDNSIPGAPVQVNATMTIEYTYNAFVDKFDDDNALDQNGNATLANLFAPSISADQTLTSDDRAGYVQFRVRFFINNAAGPDRKWDDVNYTDPIQLINLNYVHYDIDGVAGDSRDAYQLRETGVVKDTAQTKVTANANTELTAWSYPGDGANWKGYMGNICNRDNTSQCAEVVAAFSFNSALSTVVFRMGYNYTNPSRDDGLDDDQVQDRLYASTFGCFSFPAPIILPADLLSFSGSYKDKATLLRWETTSAVNVDHYEIERSSDGSGFSYSGIVATRPGDGNKQYTFTDNLASVSGRLFYYLLKMVDVNGKYKYSHVVSVYTDANTINSISILPNPVTGNNSATLRMTSAVPGNIEMRIVDLTGRIVLQQVSPVFAGTNSISINNLNLLRPGIYAIQVWQKGEMITTKISVAK